MLKNISKFLYSRPSLKKLYNQYCHINQRKNAEADQENSSNSKTGNGSAGGTGYATADPNDPPINKTNMVLASSVAISAMTAYAFHSGLVDIVKNIKVELVDEYDDEEDVDETD